MNNETLYPKRALISVSDKAGLSPLVKALHKAKVEIISTGGTLKAIEKEGVPVKHVSEITDFPEIMNGRVKTLHPLLLGGVLGLRDKHASEASAHNIGWIDMVVCNLYPFKETITKPGATLSDAVENIDVGGPTMVRSAAKNFPWVTIVTDPSDYPEVITSLEGNGIQAETRRHFAQKAFAHTSQYDAKIALYLSEDIFPETLNLCYQKAVTLRYGENPHQKAAYYFNDEKVLSVLKAKQLQGKALSYNNMVDAQAAIEAVSHQASPTAAVIKHAMPCGMAKANTIEEAFISAFMADEKSAFGGVIALNQACDEKIAFCIAERFIEIIIAPSFSDKAIECLSKKKNLRLLTLDMTLPLPDLQPRALPGGLLLQEKDKVVLSPSDLNVVTGETLDDKTISECLFAWHAVKQIKSNAILITKEGVTKGIGGGQVSRVDAVEIALKKAGNDAKEGVLASDAFFPFRDSIDLIASSGIRYVIQPGGSVRDEEVIDASKEHGIVMIFTGVRCFNH